MTEQEKIELIVHIKSVIAQYESDSYKFLLSEKAYRIALASLTALPVKLPAPIGVFMFTSHIKKALEEAGIKFEVKE